MKNHQVLQQEQSKDIGVKLTKVEMKLTVPSTLATPY